MTTFTVDSLETSVDVYSDQTNVTVEITLNNGNEWRVQTDSTGKFSTSKGCEIWLNENNNEDLTGHEDFEFVVDEAEKAAKAKHMEGISYLSV